MINEIAKEIHQNAVNKGFFEGEKNIGEMLCLIHSEVSEALECDRKGHHCDNEQVIRINAIESDILFKIEFKNVVKDTFGAELADILIRDLDLAAFKNIDLEQFVKAVMRNNSLREYKHGKKY